MEPAYRDFIETFQNIQRDPRINIAGVKNVYSAMQKLGDLKGDPPDVAKIIDSSVVEEALAARKR